MYEIELIGFSLFILFLLVATNAYRIHKYNKNHITTTVRFDNVTKKNEDDINAIMNNVKNEDDTIKSQIQDNLSKLNEIDSKLSANESTNTLRFETIEENMLDQQFETTLNDANNGGGSTTANSRLSEDVRSHFLYTDVSEENSLNIRKIENEISTLSDKIQSLQNNLNSIQYVN